MYARFGMGPGKGAAHIFQACTFAGKAVRCVVLLSGDIVFEQLMNVWSTVCMYVRMYELSKYKVVW